MSTRPVSCVVIVCDTCDKAAYEDDGDGFTAHFDTTEQAEAAIADSEWTVVKGRHQCPRCTDRAACELTGHDWMGWRDLANEYQGVVYVGRGRMCLSCGAYDYDPPLPRLDNGAATPAPVALPGQTP